MITACPVRVASIGAPPGHHSPLTMKGCFPMKALAFLLTALVGASGALMPVAGDEPGSSSPVKKTVSDPAMAELSRLVGGTWVNNNPRFVVDDREHDPQLRAECSRSE